MDNIEVGKAIHRAVDYWKSLRLKSEKVKLLDKAGASPFDYDSDFPPNKVIEYLVNNPKEME
jgi:hypothetical protein